MWYISYYLKNQSRLFSDPQSIVVDSIEEGNKILSMIEENGYTLDDIYPL